MSKAIASAVSSISQTVKVATTKGAREPEDWLQWEEVERPVEGEEEKITELCEIVKRVIDRNVEEHNHGMRGTHVKPLGYVKGTFTVKSDLPAHLRKGVFAVPGKSYPVIARYANEPSHLKSDSDNMPRGLSLKVFGVDGPRIDASAYGSTNTQDFLMNNAPMLELTDLDTALEIFRLREQHWRDPDQLEAELKKRSDTDKQLAPGTLPSKPVLGMTMFSQSAFRFGPYAAHFSLMPDTDEQHALADASNPSETYTVLRDGIREFFASGSAKYVFRAQFVSDLAEQPVEDASTEWDERLASWHDLAQVVFPPQETFSDARRIWWEETIALSPFNGLEDHRPLGSVNRLRKRVYEASRAHRASKNGDLQKRIHFPSNVDGMPE